MKDRTSGMRDEESMGKPESDDAATYGLTRRGVLSAAAGALGRQLSVSLMLVCIAVAVACIPFWTGAFAQLAPPLIVHHALPSEINYPEGVAYDPDGNALYTASAANGAVVRVDLTTGQSQTIVPPGALVPRGSHVFPAMLGMKLDGAGRLWRADGEDVCGRCRDGGDHQAARNARRVGKTDQ